MAKLNTRDLNGKKTRVFSLDITKSVTISFLIKNHNNLLFATLFSPSQNENILLYSTLRTM